MTPAGPAGPRRTGLAVVAAANAASALVGVVGLVGGGLSFGAEIDARLPFGSRPIAGLALAVAVLVPSLLLGRAAWRGDHRTDAIEVVLGACLVGWITLQVAVIRSLSPFQPTYLLIGIAFAVRGSRGRRGRREAEGPADAEPSGPAAGPRPRRTLQA